MFWLQIPVLNRTAGDFSLETPGFDATNTWPIVVQHLQMLEHSPEPLSLAWQPGIPPMR